jgi:hypothetical protein
MKKGTGMSRPYYENEDTLKAERAIAQEIAQINKCFCAKLPVRYAVDFALVDQKTKQIKWWMEVKTRPKYSMKSIGKMGGYMISLGKWMEIVKLCSMTNIRFILAVDCLDGLWATWTSLDKAISNSSMFPPHMGGRSDRNDWQDHEPVILIPESMFFRLGDSVNFRHKESIPG